jgi:AraC-like DNA-binding protein
VTRRASTQLQHYLLVQQVQTILSLAPQSAWDDVLPEVNASRSTITRAFRARGTTFEMERTAGLLDRAALVLMEQYARGEKIALLNAARAAGYRDPRYLCEPFAKRYGMTPGKIWAVGASARSLRSTARAPAPHSRHDSAAYARRRRSIIRHRRRLENALDELLPGTVVVAHIEAALSARPTSRDRVPPRPAPRRPRMRR